MRSVCDSLEAAVPNVQNLRCSMCDERQSRVDRGGLCIACWDLKVLSVIEDKDAIVEVRAVSSAEMRFKCEGEMKAFKACWKGQFLDHILSWHMQSCDESWSPTKPPSGKKFVFCYSNGVKIGAHDPLGLFGCTITCICSTENFEFQDVACIDVNEVATPPTPDPLDY